ncbi:MAG: SAM-dependent chlorinase/fluorinase [Trueperaceae bacterium]|nr:SAM-dependent chlorinase/fluorinase [Trueperaceae bacterium]
MNQSQVIAFATDFGLVDPCVGVCEGVMVSIAPDAKVVHLNHNISPQNLNEAIFNLFVSYKYFPDKTVFCFVIDPGVGSSRKAIALEFSANGKTQYLVAPDNGIATPLLNHEQVLRVISLDNPSFHLPNASTTFHGRDIFSPAAAQLAKGTDIAELGTLLPKDELVKLELPQPNFKEGLWQAQIIHMDHFGNLVTNLPSQNLEKPLASWTALAQDKVLSPVYPNFASVEIGETVVYTGSSGFIEIGVRNANARALLNLNLSDTVIFAKHSKL